MATAAQSIEDYKKRKGITDKPPSEDHVVKIKPDKDIILALDENGDELCKLAFEIDGKLCHFRTPILAKWQGFAKKYAQLLIILSQHAGNLQVPEDKVEEYKNNEDNILWKKLSALALTSNDETINLVMDIFFNYLDGAIEGVKLTEQELKHNKKIKKKSKKEDVKEITINEKQMQWFRNHLRIEDVQKMFSAILCVDDLIKKNATFMLQTTYQKSQGKNIVSFSKKKAESQQTGLTREQSSTLEQL
jgi:hypothetical protein